MDVSGEPSYWVAAVGAAMLLFSGICWSGTWRGWAQGPLLRAFPITLAPGFGLLLLVAGIWQLLPFALAQALLVIALPGSVLGLILGLWDPDWLGPKWFRRVKTAFAKGGGCSLEWLADDPRREGESSVEATKRHSLSQRPLPPFKPAHVLHAPFERLTGVAGSRGKVFFYPQAPLVWMRSPEVDGAAGGAVTEIIPKEGIKHAAREVPGMDVDGVVRRSGWRSRLVSRLRIDTDNGPWLFEALQAGYIARQIRKRYTRGLAAAESTSRRSAPEG